MNCRNMIFSLGLGAVVFPSLLTAAPKLIHAGWSDPDTERFSKYAPLMEKAAPEYSGVRIFVKGKDDNGKLVTHRMMFGSRKFKPEWFQQAVEDLKQAKCTRFTDNFIATGVQPGDVDWFSDSDWEAVCSNFALYAKIAKESGAKGLIFDSEEYSGKLWSFKNVPGRTIEECRAMVRKRGQQFGKAVFGTFPECRLFCFFWLSLNSRYTDQPETPLFPSYFIDGVYDVLPPQAMIYDGMENQGYRLRSQDDANRMIRFFYFDFPKMLSPENREKYFLQTQLACSIYLDAYFQLPEKNSYAYWFADGKKKYGAAGFFRRNLRTSLAISGDYAWTWGANGAWWNYPETKRVLWDKHCPGAHQALSDALHPYEAARRVVAEKKRPNLLINADFSKLTAKKIPVEWHIDQNKKRSNGTIEFRDGKAVFRNVLSGSVYQTLPAKGGQEYFLTAEAVMPPSADSPGAQLRMRVDYRNKKGELTGFNRHVYGNFVPSGKAGHYRCEMLFDTPEDAEKLVIFLSAANLEKNGVAEIGKPALYER